MLDELFNRRALIVVGKGGVGRTAVSAALALARARQDARVLAMEYDRMGPLTAALGRAKPSLVPVEVAPRLYALVLDGARQLEEYLGTVVPNRALLRAIVRSRAYRYFIDAAPGLRELIIIGKIFHELERRPPSPPWDLIVLDAPASGQALSLFRMPLAAHQTFGGGVVGREAHNVASLLRDPRRCAVVLVTAPEPFAVRETLETYHALREMGLTLGAVVFNRTRAPRFDAPAAARLVRRPALRAAAPHLDELCALARAELARAAAERRAIALVARRTGAPVIRLAECAGAEAGELVRALARQLVAPASAPGAGGAGARARR
ncbi:MAG TPA: ArsA-related P-loop ATPase [Candidatus Binataceae bacterium]|nr:ArsA-related P-loop ATPase [Candidatus Binataceae bacterium]